jgi:hypothetical protein
VSEASACECLLSLFPSWQRSMRGFGMERRTGGLLRVVAMFAEGGGVWGLGSPILGMGVVRALWTL